MFINNANIEVQNSCFLRVSVIAFLNSRFTGKKGQQKIILSAKPEFFTFKIYYTWSIRTTTNFRCIFIIG